MERCVARCECGEEFPGYTRATSMIPLLAFAFAKDSFFFAIHDSLEADTTVCLDAVLARHGST